MPKINTDAQQEENGQPLADTVKNAISSIAITTSPVFICGVNRKVNIGDFENIDIYAGIALPIPDASLDDLDNLSAMVEKAAIYGFGLTSKETGERYAVIKDAQSNR
jgi:hypothetical protein